MAPLSALSPSAIATLRKIEEANVPIDQEQLRRTIEFAQKIYGDTVHWTGLTYLEQALGVLHILLPFHPDADTVTACILQHALETRNVSITELEEQFGSRVRQFISGVHLLSHVSTRTHVASVDDLRLILLSVADDIRVLLVILCRRCLSLQYADKLPAIERRRLASDVLNLFSPVAARLGIHSLKQRLQDLAFPIIYPADAERLGEQREELHTRIGSFLDEAAAALAHALKDQGIAASVYGREKHLYSIFWKMKSKGLSHMESLQDLFALRVIVETEEDCYRALGALHRVGRPVANRFKDYIAFPKPNGYQSLHSLIAKLPGVPDGVLVEVQVRTRSMHREAEYGIAAHWSYKEGGSTQQSVQRVQLMQALASQHALESDSGTVARLADHIFVLTPKGDVVELPEGATPLDFAFQIHTDVGLSFHAARVNGEIVSLDYELENGDVVEIVTRRTPHPSPEWLQLLKMASSRTRLKRYLHTAHRSEYLARGRDMFNDDLRRRRLPLLDADLSSLRLHEGRELNHQEREDLLVKIGQGTDKTSSLLLRLDLLRPLRAAAAATNKLKAATKKSARFQRKDSLIELDGGVPMPIKFAKCCKPQDGDRSKIAGMIGRDGTVMVHTAKCRNALKGNPDRRIGVRWRKEVN